MSEHISTMLSVEMWHILLAGLGGGIVAFRFEEDKVTLKRIILIVLYSILAASYIGGLICELFDLSHNVCHSVRFIMGAGASKIFDGLYKMFDLFKEDPLSVIKKIWKR